MKKANLLYHTFDGDLKAVSVTPQHLDSKCTFQMDVWGDQGAGEKQSLILSFDQVAALEFSMNFCDNVIGADLGGFYKVPGKKQKRKLLERNFKRRKKDWVMTRLCDAEAEDPDNILNCHDDVDKLEAQLGKYNLYLLQSMGGAWLVLAKGYECVENGEEELQQAETEPVGATVSETAEVTESVELADTEKEAAEE